MATEIKVPTLGESVTEATVSKWFKAVGEAVEADAPLLELETDKVTMEVNAPAAGVLAEILAEEGAEVEVGALLGTLSEGSDAAPEPKGASEPEGAVEAVAPATGPATDVVVPQLGESVAEGSISGWMKKVGDVVAADEPLCELETDKVTMEVNAPVAGTLIEILEAEGTEVSVGAVIARIGDVGAAPAATSTPKDAAPPRTSTPVAAPVGVAGADMPMAPAVRKLVVENGLDPNIVPATGKNGRLTKGDVLAFIEGGGAEKTDGAPTVAPKAAKPDAADPREERVRMTKLRQIIAKRLKEAQNNAAMLTTYNEVDMTAAVGLRNAYKDMFEKKHGVRIGFMSMFVKAAVQALKDWPAVNAEIDGSDIVYKNYYDISVAVGSPQGLVVPVIRDADRLAFAEIEATIGDFGKRARDGRLKPEEMIGGTFTISNGGVYGSLMSSPILNPPQSGILGMHKMQPRPMTMPDGSIQSRPMMYLALSYDHRIVDGREAVSFLVRVKECIEDPQRLLIEV